MSSNTQFVPGMMVCCIQPTGELQPGVIYTVSKTTSKGMIGLTGHSGFWKAGRFEAMRAREEPAPSPVGRKDDNGKPRWGLLPFEAVSQVVDVLTFGAKKYAPGNWRHVPNADERYFDAAMRHMVAWKQGERKDPESGHHHLAHAACCVLFALALDQGK